MITGAILTAVISAAVFAAPPVLHLGADSRGIPLKDHGSPVVLPAVSYATQPIAIDAQSNAVRPVAEIGLDSFLLCREMTGPGVAGNPGLRVRPVYGDWIIGTYDASSADGGTTDAVPGEGAAPFYLQGSFGGLKDATYGVPHFDVTRCGPGDSACVNTSFQCYTADKNGNGVADSRSIFTAGFDEYTGANNSSVRIYAEKLPTSASDTYDYTVQWTVPQNVGSSRHVLQLGYDQSVFTNCGVPVGSGISTVLEYGDVTQSGTLQIRCSVLDYAHPPANGTPVVAAALFVHDAPVESYSDNVAFGRWASGGTFARLTVTAFGAGRVDAGTPPYAADGGINYCTSSDTGQANCTATYPRSANTSVTLNAVPDAGHSFVSWGGACSGTVPSAGVTIDADKNCTALFASQPYTLEYKAGEHGSITGQALQLVDYGQDGTPVTAVPDSHYHFASWSDGSTSNPRTDTDVSEDIDVTASFAIDAFTLTYSAGSHGSIQGPASQTVEYGADGEPVTAVADDDYRFVGWTDGSTENPRADYGVTGDIAVTATFVADQFASGH